MTSFFAHPELDELLVLQLAVPVDVISVDEHLDLGCREIQLPHCLLRLSNAHNSIAVGIKLAKDASDLGNPVTLIDLSIE